MAHLAGHDRFTLVVTNVSEKVELPDTSASASASKVDAVCNLASPASPPAYLARPFDTLAVGSEGTRRLLELAREHGARFLMASTSEIYGDPRYTLSGELPGQRRPHRAAQRLRRGQALLREPDHGDAPDPRRRRGHRAHLQHLRAPALRRRRCVVSNFIVQALRGEPLTVYGDGSQTRSLCFVKDEIRGLVALLDSTLVGPVNIGNPDERTMLELATSSWRSRAQLRTSSTSHCRPTTRPAAARHHPGPADGLEPRIGLRGGLSAQSNTSPTECKTDDLMTEPDVTETDITAVSETRGCRSGPTRR